ncbi:hypothetical protein C8R46DRAFT_1166638 [Mycena filopes]|nr:hypothetical protein C8R46DRAFT_1166638 [Mycena filopes]
MVEIHALLARRTPTEILVRMARTPMAMATPALLAPRIPTEILAKMAILVPLVPMEPNGYPRDRGNRSRPPRNANVNPNNEVIPPPDASHSQNWRAQGPSDSSGPAQRRGRGAKFNTGLTTDDPAASSAAPRTQRARQPKPAPAPVAEDLTSILTAALRTPPYPDCPICFSAIHPAQPTWSCSPSLPVLSTPNTASTPAVAVEHCCYTTFHLKSSPELAAAWAARGEPQRGGEWRCPGCQARRAIVPGPYRCFCGSTPSPAPPRIATPHSCAGPCARPRAACDHPCPLLCHPGARHLRCAAGGGGEVSCGAVCGRQLACGAHACTRPCHLDACDPCGEEKEVACGEGDAVACSRDDGATWVGRFACAEPCDRLFDCGTHRCKELCHPCHPAASGAAPCPRAPERVRTCPCGRRPIARGEDAHATNAKDTNAPFPARRTCIAPIPTCGAPCGQIHEGCGHACTAPCHENPGAGCPPCSVLLSLLLCEKPCGALAREAEVGEERGGLHECDLVCGKMLRCGLHRCEARDHKGAVSFEEVAHLPLRPHRSSSQPIPCGTVLTCPHPCPRPPPACGHPRTPHACHPDAVPCPPCPFLTAKRCMCGKKEGRERHRCARVCHLPSAEEGGGEGEEGCGKCTAPCGKPRRGCLPLHHPCTQPCHAPASCDEAAPCTCGRYRLLPPVQCGRSTSNTASASAKQPKCTNECLIAKRNARLADALGINTASADYKGAGEKAVWGDEVIGFGRANARFVGVVEKAFADFVASEKKMQVLPHMPLERRKFVHDVRFLFHLGLLLRRFDTKIPTPLLSAVLAASGPPPSLGRLADLRAGPSAGAGPSWRASKPTPPAAGTTTTAAAAGPSATAPRAVWGAAGAAPQARASAPAVVASTTTKTSQSGGNAATPPPSAPAPLPIQTPVPIPGTPVDVPDDWEDDV